MKIIFTQEELNSFVKHHLDLAGKTVEVEIHTLKAETVPSEENLSWIPYKIGDVRDVLSTGDYDCYTLVEVLLHNGHRLIGEVWKFSWDKVKAYRFV